MMIVFSVSFNREEGNIWTNFAVLHYRNKIWVQVIESIYHIFFSSSFYNQVHDHS